MWNRVKTINVWVKSRKGQTMAQKTLNSGMSLHKKDIHHFQKCLIEMNQNDTKNKNKNMPDSVLLHMYTPWNLLVTMISCLRFP